MPKLQGQKNIIITGGAGFIGSHLADELVKEANVICVDNFISGSQANIDHLLQNPNFVFIRHDMNEPFDPESFPELEKFKIKFNGVQEIYNLACPTSPKDFEKYKIITALTNSVGVVNALGLALKYKAKFLQASTSTVYGPRNKEKFLREDDYQATSPITPRSCYDEGKRFAETLSATYRDFYNLDIKIARIFRTYGPRVRLFAGEMVPDMVVQAIDNKDLIIYGDDTFETSLCFVADIVDGLLKLMSSLESGPVNLGSPDNYRLADVAQKILEMTGSKSKIVYEKPLLFMTQLGLPDIGEAKEKLGWIPITTLEKGLQKTIEYAKAQKILVGKID